MVEVKYQGNNYILIVTALGFHLPHCLNLLLPGVPGLLKGGGIGQDANMLRSNLKAHPSTFA